MSVYERLESLRIVLPSFTPAVGAYVPFQRSGNLLFVSGHIAKFEGRPWVGKLGDQIGAEVGKLAARSVAIDLVGTLHGAVGDLDKITRIVKMTVLVNSTPTFTEQHLVANAASELMVAIFGEVGRHSRSAFGVAQVPYGACVEIELVAEAVGS